MSQVFTDSGKAEAVTVIEAVRVLLLRLKQLPKKAMKPSRWDLALLKN